PHRPRSKPDRYTDPDDARLVGNIELEAAIDARRSKVLVSPDHDCVGHGLFSSRQRPIPIAVDKHLPLNPPGKRPLTPAEREGAHPEKKPASQPLSHQRSFSDTFPSKVRKDADCADREMWPDE